MLKEVILKIKEFYISKYMDQNKDKNNTHKQLKVNNIKEYNS